MQELVEKIEELYIFRDLEKVLKISEVNNENGSKKINLEYEKKPLFKFKPFYLKDECNSLTIENGDLVVTTIFEVELPEDYLHLVNEGNEEPIPYDYFVVAKLSTNEYVFLGKNLYKVIDAKHSKFIITNDNINNSKPLDEKSINLVLNKNKYAINFINFINRFL